MEEQRVHIFVDFWNLQLSINAHRPHNYRLDWRKLSPYLIQQTEHVLGTPLRFEGSTVYLSYNPATPQGKKLRHWGHNVLARFPGMQVVAKERKAKHPPRCPHCHRIIDRCPYCGAKMIGTVEKGIDTAMVTDMIKLAWEGAWDVAILISSDRDFIPVVEFLHNKGLKIINVHFPPQGAELARHCWGSIDLSQHLDALSR